VWTLLMAISRVCLGRHYITDVIGALFLAAAWVLLVYAFYAFLLDRGAAHRMPA
jgi:membrane-associated phospholipid phosphatase